MANPLVLLAGKLLLNKVVEEVEERIGESETSSGVDVKRDVVVYQGVDKKKAAAWAFVLALITLAGSMGWIPPEVAEFLKELATNPEIQEGINEAASEALE